MAWSAPMTATANSAFTAAQFNTYVRDNLNETAPAKATTAGRIFVATGANAIAERAIAGATVDTTETTTSTTYADLATSGPAVTVTTGTQALVWLCAHVSNNTASAHSDAAFAVSSATTRAAADSEAVRVDAASANTAVSIGRTLYVTGLTAGSNVFTMKYRVEAGTGSFSYRHIAVMAL